MVKIVKGYNGIMDLDLTNVPSNLHKIMIKQHLVDIEEYKEEQSNLPINLRYENTIIRAQKLRELENLHLEKRKQDEVIKQNEDDKRRWEIYNRLKDTYSKKFQ